MALRAAPASAARSAGHRAASSPPSASRASAWVCVCANVHMCVSCAGDILREQPHSHNPSGTHLQPPSPRPQCKQRAWPKRRTPPPTHPPVCSLLTPYSQLSPLTPPHPPRRLKRAILDWPRAKSEQNRYPGAARAASWLRSLTKPLENKGCCPLLPLVPSSSGSLRDGRLPSLSFLGFSDLAPGAKPLVPRSASLILGPPWDRLEVAQWSRALIWGELRRGYHAPPHPLQLSQYLHPWLMPGWGLGLAQECLLEVAASET